MTLDIQSFYRSAQRLLSFSNPDNDAPELSLASEIASQLRTARVDTGLSHLQLAKRIGTTASTVGRFEDPDFNGHSLFILDRLAKALDCHLQIRFIPNNR